MDIRYKKRKYTKIRHIKKIYIKNLNIKIEYKEKRYIDEKHIKKI